MVDDGRQLATPGDADDVRRVAAAGALGVVHVDGAAADGRQRVLDEAALVQRVGVELDLEIELVGDAEAGVDGRRHDPQSSWILRPRQPVSSCSTSEAGLCELPRPRKPKFIGQCSAACSILPTLNGPPESMPTVIGPSEPPSMVVMPEAMACSTSARGIEMDMDVDRPGGGDQALAVAHRGRRADDQVGIDAVHDRRVAGLAEADDPAVLDAEVALDDAEHRIDDDDVADQHVERAVRALHAGGQPHAVAQRLAAAVQAFVAGDGVVVLDLGPELGVAEADAVAHGRAVHRGIVGAGHRCHGQAPLKPAARARASAACLPASSSADSLVSALSPPIAPVPPKGTSVTALRLPRLEADGGAGRNVEPHAEGFAAIEFERLVDLEEVEVAADLHRPVAGIEHGQRCLRPAGVELDVAGRRHGSRRAAGPASIGKSPGRIGSWTVTSLVPSGNTPST